jgi:hypothetical protein
VAIKELGKKTDNKDAKPKFKRAVARIDLGKNHTKRDAVLGFGEPKVRASCCKYDLDVTKT